MLLIDSLYINNSGGFLLLDYLARVMTERNIPFFLLADDRCRNRLDYCNRVQYISASMKNRRRFYLRHRLDFSAVFCFGNIPAPIKMQVPVYTYFHNINLLTLAETKTIKLKVTGWLKRQVFRHYKLNTDLWLVQTTNTANELISHLHEKDYRVRIMPFYNLPTKLKQLHDCKHGNDFVYIANYTGAKGHEELLEAWILLHKRGIDRRLHLTINEGASEFIYKIKKAQENGIKIVNHGFVPFNDVIKLYQQSKAIIYPSHNESLGLGIIEAIEAGCDVIGSDRPFIHSICRPSVTCNPYSAQSIADAVEEYERGNFENSELLIHNHIDELIELITSHNKKTS